MTSVGGLFPPATTALVELLPAAGPNLATVKLPKSVAFPVVAIVMKSISSLLGDSPPNQNPRVLEPAASNDPFDDVKLPKSIAFPCVEIVIYSIVSTEEGNPPPKQPRTPPSRFGENV